jgi:hypothetical protein
MRRSLLMATLVAAHIAPQCLALAIGSNGVLEILALATLGAPAWLGMWAIVGPGPAWARCPRMLLWLAGLVALALVPVTPRADDFLGIGLALSVGFATVFCVGGFVAACSISLVLRVARGWRLRAVGDAAAQSSRQISLRALLGDITALAIVLAVFGRVHGEVTRLFIDGFRDPDDYGGMALGALMLGLLELPMVPVVPLVLAERRPRIGRAIALSFGLLAVGLLGVGTVSVLAGASYEEVSQVAEWLLVLAPASVAYTGVVAGLFVLRLAGYRLVTYHE